MASSLSKSVTPRPLPVSRLTSMSIFAPSSPGGVSPDSTSPRTMLIASSTVAGSLSNVAMRAYTFPPWPGTVSVAPTTREGLMRIESSVTAISWIPSEAIQGMPKIPFELGIGHYDEPPPDHLERGDLPRLRDEDRFREANDLRAWIEVEDGKIVDHGHEGDGYVGTTTFKLGPKDLVFQGVAFDVLRPETEVRDGEVRFVQTVGGRAGFPAPRRVKGRPFMRVH